MAIKTRPMPRLYCSYFAKNPEIETDKGDLSEWQYNTVSGQIRLTGPKAYDINKKYYVPQANGKSIYYKSNMFKNSKSISFIDFQHVPVYNNNLNEAFWACYYIADVRNINNNVTNMSYCFEYIRTNINVKLPTALIKMTSIFYNAYNFNRYVTIPKNVTDMGSAFSACTIFNQPIEIPNKVVNMNRTFLDCSAFNQAMIIPDSVTDLFYTFRNCPILNQPITIGKGATRMEECFSYSNNFSSTVTIYSTELAITTNSAFSSTPTDKAKTVKIYYEYANGVKTKSYNSIVANSKYKWHGKNGVTVVNMGRAPW